MNRVLLDTNILLRAADPSHAMHEIAVKAVRTLLHRGDRPCLVAQVVVEFRAVATRPRDANGLGMTQLEVDSEIMRLSNLYPILADTEEILPEWS